MQRGTQHTVEAKARMRAAKLGKPSAPRGSKHKPETKVRMAETQPANRAARKAAQGVA